MMEEKDLLEYENIGRKIKRNDKYNYVSGKQIEDQGTRIYDVAGFRLPSQRLFYHGPRTRNL